MALKSKSNILIFLVCLVVLGLIFLLGASMSRLKKDFRTEVAKRLETEEAMLKMENERASLVAELNSLKEEFTRLKDKAEALTQELDKERSSRVALQAAYEKAKEAQAGAPAVSGTTK